MHPETDMIKKLVFFATIVLAMIPLSEKQISAAGRWNRLYSDSADASSFLQNNWNKYKENYHPNYILDDNPETAWVEGASQNGEGETLTYRVSTLSTANAVQFRIRNGYQKSKKLFTANAAPKMVSFSLLSSDGEVVVTKKVTLKQKWGWQNVEIKIPGAKGFSEVRLKIESVYPGTVYKDTCISDIQTYVDSSVTYNKSVEENKQKRLMTWIRGRLDTAKYFAEAKQQYPFVSTHFEKTNSTPLTDALWSRIKTLYVEVDALQKEKTWFRAVSKNTIQSFPDGLSEDSHHFHYLREIKSLLDSQDVSLFEASNAIQQHQKSSGEDEAFYNEMWYSNYHPVWSDSEKKKLKQLYFWTKEVGEERSSYEYRHDFILFYDDMGRLSSLYCQYEDYNDFMPHPSGFIDLLQFHYNQYGKIDRVEVVTSSVTMNRRQNQDVTVDIYTPK